MCLARGKLSQAQEQVKDVLRYLEDHTLGNVVLLRGPLRVHLTCYRVLSVNGDSRAQGILDTAYELLQECAARISDGRFPRM